MHIRCFYKVFCLLLLLLLTACSDTDSAVKQTTAVITTAAQTETVFLTETEEPPTAAEGMTPCPTESSAVTTEAVPLLTSPAETEPIESIPVDPAVYFENSLFVGDSILEGLAQYVRAQRQGGTEMLSDAKFLTSIMGIRVADLVGDTADYERIRYQYRGAVCELTEIVTQAMPKRLFLLVGMNDLAGGASVEDTIARYTRLLTQLKTDFPSLAIVVMTPTPKTASAWLPDYCTNPAFDSALLREFADALISLCESQSLPCVDIFTALADDTGNLPDSFSRDNYVHINDLGSAVVVDALNQFAKGGSAS